MKKYNKNYNSQIYKELNTQQNEAQRERNYRCHNNCQLYSLISSVPDTKTSPIKFLKTQSEYNFYLFPTSAAEVEKNLSMLNVS